MARGRFHPLVGGDSTKHDGLNAVAAQMQVQLGAVNRVPRVVKGFDLATQNA